MIIWFLHDFFIWIHQKIQRNPIKMDMDPKNHDFFCLEINPKESNKNGHGSKKS